MDCIVDLKKEGNSVIAYLPFNPRVEWEIPKGSIYVTCIMAGATFKSRLISKGNEKHFILFNKQLLKNLGFEGDKHLGVPLCIAPDITIEPEFAEPEMLDNETIKAIRERASIRKFRDKKIGETQLNTIVNAGLCAPSATNKRPFHFIVTQNREKMIRIMGTNPYVKMLENAAACVIVCGDKIVQGIPEWLLEDCSAATQNMLLAIHSIGLGGVWCGVKQGSEFHKNIVREFNLPSYIRPVSLIAFGYADQKKDQPNRYELGKVHFETW